MIKQLGEILRNGRLSVDLNQEDVAAYLGLTRTSIINIEKGRHCCTFENLYNLCCLYKLEPNDLFPKVNHCTITNETKTIKITKTVKKIKKHITK